MIIEQLVKLATRPATTHDRLSLLPLQVLAAAIGHYCSSVRGAEIIFAPTWGNTLHDADGRVNGESVFQVRARDNGVYMVPSVYDGNSLVINPMGMILTSSNGKSGVFWAEIDLNTREALRWVGYWRSIGPRHRMHHTYTPLSKGLNKPTY